MSETTYNVIAPESGVPVKAWTKGVPLEDSARKQLLNAAQLPFIFKWIAAMPDVHWGIGATVGSVIPTKGAIIPAAVGVDIGCGMMAVQTSLNARDLPDNLKGIRTAIETAVPHGRTNHGGVGDRGAWHDIPERNGSVWLGELKARYDAILAKHPRLDRGNHANHLGTLGTGNHFIEVCLDESETAWFMLHSGSRGVGRYYVEWYVGGTRRRVSAGVTAAQALEVQRRKHHELEGRKLGIPGFETAGETVKKPALHIAIAKYLEQIDALKKPNTHRKYEAVLNRFGEFFRDCVSIDAISGDDLTRFVVTLKKDHGLGSNTILHNAVIVAQFLKRHGRSGITRELSLPERITPLVKIYRHEELARFFAVCSDQERALFATFLLTGFREQEVMFLRWSDVNFELRTVRVTSKPELGFYPKRWEDREIPAPVELIDELRKHTHRPNCQFVFPSPTGNREQHMLDHCKSIARRAKLDPTKFDLKTFRSTYATGMLRRGFDVRTVQHWMGHKSLETTMRYLAPATDVHDQLDLVTIPFVGKADPAPRKSAARESRSSRKADQG